MEWKPIITPAKLETLHSFFPRLRSNLHARIVLTVLKRIERFLGYPIGINLPIDTEPFHNNPESLRALRLMIKLKKEKFLKSFYFDVHDYADEPTGHVTVARLEDIDRLGFSGKGADMFDKAKTLWPTLGEAIERYAIYFFYPKKGDYRDSSYDELPEPKVDIFSIAGFDNVLRSGKHDSFILEYDRDTSFRWIKSLELTEQKETWAPLQWFSFSHLRQYSHKATAINDSGTFEPLLGPSITTGVATGQSLSDATFRGLLEVIERDAFIIYWLNQITPERIDTSTFHHEGINEMVKIAKRYHLELHVLYLKTDVPVHTVCTLLIDRSGIGPALTLGTKTTTTLFEAVYGSMSDVLSQRGVFRKMMDDPEYQPHKSIDLKAIGHLERMHYWFSVDKLPYIDWLIGGKTISAASLPIYSYAPDVQDALAELLKFFAEKRYRVYAKELLNEKLRNLTEGLSVVMVRVPQLQPLSLEESLSTLGGERLYEIPQYLGHTPKKDRDQFFMDVPHPFP